MLETLSKGFSININGEAPNSIMKKFRDVMEVHEDKSNPYKFLFRVLMKNSSIKLKFKSPQMVDKFFDKLGIQ